MAGVISQSRWGVFEMKDNEQAVGLLRQLRDAVKRDMQTELTGSKQDRIDSAETLVAAMRAADEFLVPEFDLGAFVKDATSSMEYLR
jgi:hypothetical protein